MTMIQPIPDRAKPEPKDRVTITVSRAFAAEMMEILACSGDAAMAMEISPNDPIVADRMTDYHSIASVIGHPDPED